MLILTLHAFGDTSHSTKMDHLMCGREVGADDSRERVTCLHSPTLSDGELSDESFTTGSVENRT